MKDTIIKLLGGYTMTDISHAITVYEEALACKVFPKYFKYHLSILFEMLVNKSAVEHWQDAIDSKNMFADKKRSK
jgi:hypothetical protein